MFRKFLAILLVSIFALGFQSLPAHSSNSGIVIQAPGFIEQEAVQSGSAGDFFLYLPVTFSPRPVGPWVDITSREAVKTLYQVEYLGTLNVNPGWTGSVASCIPGTNEAAFRDAILRQVNFFRSMAGIPAVVAFDDTYNTKAQAAALMMSANGALSHTPPTTWKCYTADGDEAAGSSNLALGVSGPETIGGYMLDPGGGNYPVGHRRWILYPQTQYMGTGDIPSGSGYWAANALWVFDTVNMWKTRPATRESFVAWPPPGYVPYQVVYPRWSFAVAGADFDNATVSMSGPGGAIALSINPTEYGFGENTLVWEPVASFNDAPASDTSYLVSINNVEINGTPTNYSYTVIIFDPAK